MLQSNKFYDVFENQDGTGFYGVFCGSELRFIDDLGNGLMTVEIRTERIEMTARVCLNNFQLWKTVSFSQPLF